LSTPARRPDQADLNGPTFHASAFSPGLLLTATVLAIYFLGDGLRDVLDPRLRM
jgi:ABC-type dipeptide/oligopeptide/nickel transport system permease subunit